jgi:rhodanese-related sulfurtransferase
VEAARAGQRWIVVCSEGYTSSLAADVLNSIGVAATDIEGGFAAWAAAGLETVPGGTETGRFVAARPEKAGR